MKKYLLFSAFVLLYSVVNAQQSDPQNKKVITDSEPYYLKGEPTLYNEVYSNTDYPEEAKKKYIEGEVTLSFDVKADSTVSNVVILSGVGNGVDEAVKKLVEKLKFVPGVQNGKPVKMNSIYTFPVKAH